MFTLSLKTSFDSSPEPPSAQAMIISFNELEAHRAKGIICKIPIHKGGWEELQAESGVRSEWEYTLMNPANSPSRTVFASSPLPH